MSQTARNLKTLAPALAVMLTAFALALSAACRGADQVPPAGAVIDLAANPTTIVLIGGTGSSEIVATVSSEVGVPLKNQDVRFTASAGSLFTLDGDSGANIPIRTDDLGNAHVTLVTTKTTTVSARSGTADGTLTLDTVNGNIQAILLNQDTAGAGCLPDQTFTSCSDTLCIEAQAVDQDGNGLIGVVIVFALQNAENSMGDPIAGSFTPTQATTVAGGFVRATFRLGSACPTVCGGGENCQGEIVAALQGGGFPSTPLIFDTSIP